MYRFYCQDADFAKKDFLITDTYEIHHIKTVLRLAQGAKIQIFNGQSQEAEGVIEKVQDKGILVCVKSVRENVKGHAKIILACAPPKKGKFEWIVEKCTELGVDEIIPLKTKRSEVVFDEARMVGKLNRFQTVAVNASKQSKRMAVPRIHAMTALPEVLKNLDPGGLHLFPSLHQHAQHISQYPLKVEAKQVITVFIGPEGDFTPEELALAVKHGCQPVTLGDTVLKVETAAIAVIAFVMFSQKA